MSSATAEIVLDVQDLQAGYGGFPVIHGVNLQVHAGEIVAVVGPNGAGKSTLLKTINGLLAVHAGTVIFNGADETNTPAEHRAALGMGYVPQDNNTFPDLTVRDNLAVALLRQNPVEVRRRISEVALSFPALEERMNRNASTLSGGERQMLAVASAMITRPTFLALDEPTTGLAPSIVHDRIDDILRIRDDGTPVLWVIEENPLMCLPHVDRVYVMQAGVVDAPVSSEAVLQDAALNSLFFGVDAGEGEA
jgi:branched-chain amino acid transport system ATP-binding protein